MRITDASTEFNANYKSDKTALMQKAVVAQ